MNQKKNTTQDLGKENKKKSIRIFKKVCLSVILELFNEY